MARPECHVCLTIFVDLCDELLLLPCLHRVCSACVADVRADARDKSDPAPRCPLCSEPLGRPLACEAAEPDPAAVAARLPERCSRCARPDYAQIRARFLACCGLDRAHATSTKRQSERDELHVLRHDLQAHRTRTLAELDDAFAQTDRPELQAHHKALRDRLDAETAADLKAAELACEAHGYVHERVRALIPHLTRLFHALNGPEILQETAEQPPCTCGNGAIHGNAGPYCTPDSCVGTDDDVRRARAYVLFLDRVFCEVGLPDDAVRWKSLELVSFACVASPRTDAALAAAVVGRTFRVRAANFQRDYASARLQPLPWADTYAPCFLSVDELPGDGAVVFAHSNAECVTVRDRRTLTVLSTLDAGISALVEPGGDVWVLNAARTPVLRTRRGEVVAEAVRPSIAISYFEIAVTADGLLIAVGTSDIGLGASNVATAFLRTGVVHWHVVLHDVYTPSALHLLDGGRFALYTDDVVAAQQDKSEMHAFFCATGLPDAAFNARKHKPPLWPSCGARIPLTDLIWTTSRKRNERIQPVDECTDYPVQRGLVFWAKPSAGLHLHVLHDGSIVFANSVIEQCFFGTQ